MSTLSAEDLVEESLSLNELSLVPFNDNLGGLSLSLTFFPRVDKSILFSTESIFKLSVRGFVRHVFDGGVDPVPTISSGIASQFALKIMLMN